jgi:hypothetical protein
MAAGWGRGEANGRLRLTQTQTDSDSDSARVARCVVTPLLDVPPVRAPAGPTGGGTQRGPAEHGWAAAWAGFKARPVSFSTCQPVAVPVWARPRRSRGNAARRRR